jgi:hypothetical protein
MLPATRTDQLRAAAVALVSGWLLLMGPPGCDFVPAKDLRSDETRAAARDIAGGIGVGFIDLLARVELDVRRPFSDVFKPVERIFRISQQWYLYRDGPSRVKRLEVWVDDDLVFRTGDPDATWRVAQFSNRRFRPMVETAAIKEEAVNWAGIGRFIVDHAREDFPAAQQVRIVSTVARFGEPEVEEHHARIARAPRWQLTKQVLPKEPK